MLTDGEGVTTLAAFHGCPLRCKYCLNPQSLDDKSKVKYFSPQELYDKVKIDELYFLATGGGITFGGGEPLLYPDFINEFRSICGIDWNIMVETSLNVPWDNVEKSACSIDNYFIDCKDVNGEIYRSYTGQDNRRMLDNLKKLIEIKGGDKIIVRVPLIKGYNNEDNRLQSKIFLKELGIPESNIDLFTYKT